MSEEHGLHIDPSNKRIALLVAVLAAFLAICEMGGKSAQTEVLTQHVEAANLWTFFQAKTVRQTVVRTAAEEAHADLMVIGRGSTPRAHGHLPTNSYAIVRESPCPVVAL